MCIKIPCHYIYRLCSSKGWNEPLLLLAMPRGTKPKDKVVMRTSQATRPQVVYVIHHFTEKS